MSKGLVIFMAAVFLEALTLLGYFSIAAMPDEHDREQAYYEFGAFFGFLVVGPAVLAAVGLFMMAGG